MTESTTEKKIEKKGIFAKWMEKMDKKLKDASQKKGCCCSSSNKEKDSSCC